MRAALLALCLLCVTTSASAQVGAIAPSRAPDLSGASLATRLSTTLARSGPLSQHALDVDVVFSGALGCQTKAVLRPFCAAARVETGFSVGTLSVRSRSGLLETRRGSWPGVSTSAVWSPLHFGTSSATFSPVLHLDVDGLGGFDPESDAPVYRRTSSSGGLVFRSPGIEIGARLGSAVRPENLGIEEARFSTASTWGRWCADAGTALCAELGLDVILSGDDADERVFAGLVAHSDNRAVGLWFLREGGPGSPFGLIVGVEAGL